MKTSSQTLANVTQDFHPNNNDNNKKEDNNLVQIKIIKNEDLLPLTNDIFNHIIIIHTY